MTAPRLVTALLSAACLVLGAGGCGIATTGVVELGEAPIISTRPTNATIYLLRNGLLEPVSVSVASDSIEDVLVALFVSGHRPPRRGLTSALSGFSYADSRPSSWYGQGARNDPDAPRGVELTVVVSGEGALSRAALAQITCTARLSGKEIWAVKVTRISSEGQRTSKAHICRDFRDLAPRGAQIPP
jgi:hypothetical protein